MIRFEFGRSQLGIQGGQTILILFPDRCEPTCQYHAIEEQWAMASSAAAENPVLRRFDADKQIKCCATVRDCEVLRNEWRDAGI